MEYVLIRMFNSQRELENVPKEGRRLSVMFSRYFSIECSSHHNIILHTTKIKYTNKRQKTKQNVTIVFLANLYYNVLYNIIFSVYGITTDSKIKTILFFSYGSRAFFKVNFIK